MHPCDTGEGVEGRALRAFGLVRATGAPWLACMTGVEAVPTDDMAARELRLGGAIGSPRLGLLDAAMLADLALGAALRSRLGGGRPLPTLTLTLELDPAPLPTGTSVRCWSEPVDDGLGRSHGVFLHGESPVGRCSAIFATPRSAADLAPLPWETTETTTAPGELAEPLTEAELAVLAAVRTLGGPHRDSGRPWTDALLATACSADPAGLAGTVLHPNAAMLNRSGKVQGAVLFWLASVPSMAALALEDARLVSGHLQFLSAADPHAPLSASPAVLHTTRRTLFVRTDIRQGQRFVASGTFVYRRVA